MIKTIIVLEDGTLATQLEPSEGYKYVTDGGAYATKVVLGVNTDENTWHDTNDEPPLYEPEATSEDYEESLESLGVNTDEEENA